MYPTCVGMNRYGTLERMVRRNVPHMRGDEPRHMHLELSTNVMYPTCVGMNRVLIKAPFGRLNVPHMRGDEPLCIR